MSQENLQHRLETEEKTSNDETAQEQCEECGGALRENEQQGEFICEDCGLVADEDIIDRGPEWRAFSNEEKNSRSRVGAPTTKTLHDKGLSTNISWENKDAYGNTLSSRQRKKMSRLRKWNERFRTRDAKERNLKQALSEISRMCSALGLNEQIEETAGVLYRRCLDEDLLAGRSIEGMATACVYAAARQCNMPRSLDEIYPVSRLDTDSDERSSGENEINRSYRYITRELGLEMEPVDPRDFLNRYINKLPIEKEQGVRQKAEEMLDTIERENMHSGKSPTGLAAAAIYCGGLINQEGLTQGEVAEVAETSEVTIRNRYQEMMKAAGYMSDSDE